MHMKVKGNGMKISRFAERREKLAQEGRLPGGDSSKGMLEKLGYGKRGQRPKNADAYEEIARAVPGFEWKAEELRRTGKDGSYTQTVVHFDGYPSIGREAPSLADLVRYSRGDVALHFDQFDRHVQKHVQPLCDVRLAGQEVVGEEFARLLVSLPVSFPPTQIMQSVAEWLSRAMSGEPSTIFSGVCPDYEVDCNGRYTFNSLGSGVGIVAKRVQDVLPRFWGFTRAFNLNVKFVVAIGDFEASDECCRRVGVTREEFHARLRKSQEAFRAGLNPELPLETPFATEVGDWGGAMREARAAVVAGKLSGAYPLTENDFAEICAARKPLYERWYQVGADIPALLRRQAPEYGAMGTVAERAYPNVLVLGGDATTMSIFWQVCAEKIRPVMYLRRKDY